MINNKGSISIIAINICSLIFLLSLVVSSIFLENYHFDKKYGNDYNLSIIENMIVKNIYDDYKNVSLDHKNLSYKSKTKKQENDIEYEISLVVKNDVYKYYALYDVECKRLIEFNQISSDLSI